MHRHRCVVMAAAVAACLRVNACFSKPRMLGIARSLVGKAGRNCRLTVFEGRGDDSLPRMTPCSAASTRIARLC